MDEDTLPQKKAGQLSSSHFAAVIRRSSRYIQSHHQEYDPSEEASNIYETALKSYQVPFRRLFEFANLLDYSVIVFGILFTLASGFFWPCIVYEVGLFLQKLAELYYKCPVKTCDRHLGLYVGLFYAITSFGYAFCFLVVSKRQRHKFRIEYFRGILTSDYAFLDNYLDRNLPYRMMSDVMELQYGTGPTLATTVYASTAVVVMLAISLHINWKIAMIPFFVVPFLVLLVYLKTKAEHDLTIQEQSSYDKADIIAREILPNIHLVNIFEGQELELARYRAALISPMRFWKKIIMSATWTACMWVVTIGLWIIVVFLSIIGGLSAGERKGSESPVCNVSCAVYETWEATSAPLFIQTFVITMNALFISRGITTVIGALIRTNMTRKKAAEIFFFIDRESRINSLSNKGEIPSKGAVGKLELVSVHFAYPKRYTEPVLHDVSMLIHPGQMVTIFGPPGCGKSSILKILLRLYDVVGGIVKFDGKGVEELNIGWLRRQFGYVAQEPILFNMTIAENLSLFTRTVTRMDIEQACKETGILKTLKDLPNGLDTIVGSKSNIRLPLTLVKKICFTRVLLKRPRIMLLDEFMTDLDEDPESEIMQLFERLRDWTTIIFTTNKVHHLVKNSDIVYAMRDGRIVEVGHHDNMLSRKGAYHHILEETLEERITFKPFFMSQLRNYKFASAIRHQHDLLDTGTDFDMDEVVKDKKIRESVLCRHVIAEHRRNIPVRSIGGIQNLFTLRNEPPMGSAVCGCGNEFKSQLLSERDLRAKIFPTRAKTRIKARQHQLMKNSSSPMIIPRRSNDERAISFSSVAHAGRSRSVSFLDPPIFASRSPSRTPPTIPNQRLRVSNLASSEGDIFSRIFGTNSNVPEASTDPPTKRVRRTKLDNTSLAVIPLSAESVQNTEHHHTGSNDTVLTVDPGTAHFVDDRLRHYVGWTLNSAKDSESISSIDSAAFWYEYTRSTQQALRTKTRQTSFRLVTRLAKFSWPYLVFTFFTSISIPCLLAVCIFLSDILILELLNPSKDRDLYEDLVRAMPQILIIVVGLTFIQEIVVGFGVIKATNNSRLVLFEGFLHCSASWFDRTENDIGFLCECLRTDPPSLNSVFISWCSHWTQILMWSLAFIICTVGSPELFPEYSVFFILIPVLIVIKYYEERWEQMATKLLGYERAHAGEIVYDAISNIRFVIAYGLNDLFLSKFIAALENTRRAQIILGSVVGATVHALSDSLTFFSVMFFTTLSYRKLAKEGNQEVVAQYLRTMLVLLFGLYPMVHALSQLPRFSEVPVAAWLFHEVLVEKTKTRSRQKVLLTCLTRNALDVIASNARGIYKPTTDHAHQLCMIKSGPTPPSLSLENVWFAFPALPNNQVLKGLSMQIPAGSFVAFTASVNAGKSAIIGLLLNLYHPTKGNVLLNNQDFTDVNEEYLRSMIGYVEQDPSFMNYLTIAENIAYGNNTRVVTEEQIMEAAKLAHIASFIERQPLNYRTILQDLPENADTFAFRQRLGIARAFVKPTNVMLVDDCTVSVDNETTALLLEALMYLRPGRTFVVASKRIEPIRDADVIYFIEDGVVVEQGTDEQLLAARGKYYDRYMSQLLYETNDPNVLEKPELVIAARTTA